LIEQNKAKPFFIGCGFHKPHLPWVAPKKYFDLYKPDQIPLPKTPPDDRNDIPPLALTSTKGDDQMSELERKQAVPCLSRRYVLHGRAVGRGADAPTANKLWDNTVVLLFGDHGWHLYDHLQLWRKMTVFEEARTRPDRVCSLEETERGLAAPGGIRRHLPDPHATGRCRRPRAWKARASSRCWTTRSGSGRRLPTPWWRAARGRSAVACGRDRYRYTEWNGGKDGVEFYDHETDVNEWTT
jgi:uncharacterized sulfatase